MCIEEFAARAHSFFTEKGIDAELFEGSAGKGWSAERTQIILRTYGLKTRVLAGDFESDTATNIFGTQITFPVMPAPLSGAVKVIDRDCFTRIADESKAAGVLPWIGYPCERRDIEGLRDFIWIIKPLKDRRMLYREIEFAEERCVAVGVDLDCFAFEKIGNRIFPYEYLKALSFDELSDLVSITKLPFVAKGILSEIDYDLAVKAGCDAIVISNRGGRILESAVSPVEVLARIEKQITTGIDSFLRSGEDVLKVLALGADFVLVGRPVVYGLTIENGVKAVLECLGNELKQTMKVCGFRNLKEINPDVLVQL
ncbi:alpha-hydroxy acid oxidase [Archaeoglobus sp.]